MKYTVELTCTYNGSMTVEAESEDEALQIAQNGLNADTLKEFPDYVSAYLTGVLHSVKQPQTMRINVKNFKTEKP